MANNSIGCYAQGGTNEIGAYEYVSSGSSSQTLTFTGSGTVAFLREVAAKRGFSLSGSAGLLVSVSVAALSLGHSGTGTVSLTLALAINRALNYLNVGTLQTDLQIAISMAKAIAATATVRFSKGGDLEGAINPVDAMPRDLLRIREFIETHGGPWAGSLQDDYRTALCVATGLTEEQATSINISNAWALYAADRGL